MNNKIKHIVIFGSDAFGSYLFKDNQLKNLNFLIDNGAYSFNNHAVIPTVSANSWTSFIKGVSTNIHGCAEWNSATSSFDVQQPLQSLFALVKNHDPTAKTCAFFKWSHWQRLIEIDQVDHYYNILSNEDLARGDEITPATELVTDLFYQTHDGTASIINDFPITSRNSIAMNDKVVEMGINYLAKAKPFLSLIYVDEPDHTGHALGHQTDHINQAVEQVDKWVGKVLNVINSDEDMKNHTLFLFVADHGGISLGPECHGGITPLEIKIPVILYAPNIVIPGEIKYPLMQYDVIKTIAWKLGILFPAYWNGRILFEIFNSVSEDEFVMYERTIGTYALYHNGNNIFLVLGLMTAVQRAAKYARHNNINHLKIYDKTGLLMNYDINT